VARVVAGTRRSCLAIYQMMAGRPQTLYGLADSPVALAAYLMDHGDGGGEPAAALVAGMRRTSSGTGELTRDEILDNITLYWLTNTGVSASRLYWEYKGGFFNVKGVKTPTAVSVFPGEQYLQLGDERRQRGRHRHDGTGEPRADRRQPNHGHHIPRNRSAGCERLRTSPELMLPATAISISRGNIGVTGGRAAVQMHLAIQRIEVASVVAVGFAYMSENRAAAHFARGALLRTLEF
jgi:hypothetical protein